MIEGPHRLFVSPPEPWVSHLFRSKTKYDKEKTLKEKMGFQRVMIETFVEILLREKLDRTTS